MRGRYAGVRGAAPPERVTGPLGQGRVGVSVRTGGPCPRAAERTTIRLPVVAPGPTAGGAEEAVMTEQAERVEGPQARGPRVVVGVDGSAGARAAVRFAVEDAVR